MAKKSNQKVVFLREEYAEGRGSFEFDDCRYEGEWKNRKFYGQWSYYFRR